MFQAEINDFTSEILSLPSGWSAASTICIREDTTGRALPSLTYTSDDMTIETCVNFCDNARWQYAGVSYGRECYCADALFNSASLDKPSSACTMPCAANNSTICGGGNAVQLHINPSLAQDLTIVDNYYHQGCVKEVTGRLLATNSFAYSGMTLEMCIGFCANQGLPLAG
ncbi:hypothetical protein I307_04357 [Cryptococcus deuterogattii 99/473]|uniref:Unplaced genomic scaffold supercont1.5, whole genome shotgun sequence n=2 Tax=Cryptococcus deuterogattii TaxID=1859096 RepID=A0A0D0T5S5_9TREE|nr:hypothetical protein CNBG_2554 [Cryptococcus deuterogattii R265]KIR26361.1 hypothetical protein I309_04695 [Cryptococcus deuterogattii LA55]KIR34331.1 hypothetical protein I352_03575 [Cryptococcus deuterogattii MMRL2647]KIR41282.1 hypothetical protein I313_02402 [Cryptococcus deuterogattii Ram5]KIR69973.1 hypothetical protein I310_06293 [Cryptococcus deuterogattii CA1014]KIR89976.1 hypothetical protein I304_06228 [Cryptococcus deuterogattii CBS 10090]KIR98703.1 hypothetical protein L804_04